MTLLIVSFFAGILTVLAPCVLPLLPVIIGGSVLRGGQESKSRDWRSPVIICASLAVSVVVFTLLLKATTSLLGVPQTFWGAISGFIILLFGLQLVWPRLWERLSARFNLTGRSGSLLTRSSERRGIGGDMLLGAALGPAFNSCSPTYALIVATVLPASFAEGTVYLLAYALGLAGMLLLIAFAGQSMVRRLGWLANPHGAFRRVAGAVMLVVGAAVLFGIDRDVQAFILEQGWYDPIAEFEQRIGL